MEEEGSRPTFFEQICRTGADHPEREALLSDDDVVTYGELPQIITHFEDCLRQAGIRPFTTVGIQIAADIPHILVALALLKMNCSQATIASTDSASRNEVFARRLNIASILSMKSGADALHPTTNDFIVTHRQHDEVNPSPDFSPTVFLTTSGTTKDARITPVDEKKLAANCSQWRAFPAGNRSLWLAPVEQNVGKRTRLMDIYCGFTSAWMTKGPRTWANIVNFINRNKLTQAYIPILDISGFIHSAAQRLDPSVAMSTGGTRISWPFRQQILEKMTRNLYVRYGMTELYGIANAGPEDHDESETVGLPTTGVDLEVVDKAGTPVAAGQIGEIRMKAEGMIDGYYDDPIETAAKFRNGWFYPGDLGSLTKDGQLVVHGRADDMMILNGINIYPSEVERAFDAHPDVAASAAFPVKSRIHGEIPVVALELNLGSQITEAELLAYAREKLGMRGPRKIMLMDKLPRNALGKVLKTELAAKLNRTNERNKT